MLIIIINFNNMFNIKNKERGFTLIELLIVIAIIGVLAATVVVSLGSQTDQAQKGSTKIGVSSIRNLATVAVAEGGVDDASGTKQPLGPTGVCPLIYDQVSGEKGGWDWGKQGTDKAAQCGADAANSTGEICCASADKAWVLWGLFDGIGRPGGKVYCVDSTGFAGEITLGATVNNSTKVEDGDPSKAVVTCK